jgi:hypothetical protein
MLFILLFIHSIFFIILCTTTSSGITININDENNNIISRKNTEYNFSKIIDDEINQLLTRDTSLSTILNSPIKSPGKQNLDNYFFNQNTKVILDRDTTTDTKSSTKTKYKLTNKKYDFLNVPSSLLSQASTNSNSPRKPSYEEKKTENYFLKVPENNMWTSRSETDLSTTLDSPWKSPESFDVSKKFSFETIDVSWKSPRDEHTDNENYMFEEIEQTPSKKQNKIFCYEEKQNQNETLTKCLTNSKTKLILKQFIPLTSLFLFGLLKIEMTKEEQKMFLQLFNLMKPFAINISSEPSIYIIFRRCFETTFQLPKMFESIRLRLIKERLYDLPSKCWNLKFFNFNESKSSIHINMEGVFVKKWKTFGYGYHRQKKLGFEKLFYKHTDVVFIIKNDNILELWTTEKFARSFKTKNTQSFEIELKDFYVTVFNQFHISFLPFYLEQVKLKTNKVKEKSCCIIV